MNSISIWSTLSSFLSTGIAVLVEIALLIVALTVVRSKNAAASGFMAASAGVQLFCSLTYPLITAAMGAALRGSGDMVAGYAVVGIAMSVFRAVGAALLIVGIVKLANPPPANQNPYR